MRRRRSFFEDIDEFFEEFEREIEEMFERFSRFAGTEMKGPIVYGFRVTIGPDGVPRFEEFGNVKRLGTRPKISEEREPLYDIYEEPDKFTIYVELPGVEKDKIDVSISGRTLIVRASDGNRKYYKEIELPADVEPSSAKAQYRNGVLEIKIEKKHKEEKKEGVKIKVE